MPFIIPIIIPMMQPRISADTPQWVLYAYLGIAIIQLIALAYTGVQLWRLK